MTGKKQTDIKKILEDYYLSFQKDGYPISVNFRALVPELKKAERFTHLIHSYPAKLLANIPYFFFATDTLCPANGTVLDPFCGTGTVLLEAALSGRNALGADANPLAKLITDGKTVYIPREQLQETLKTILGKAKKHMYPLLDKTHYVDDDHKKLEITTEQLGTLLGLLIGKEEYLRTVKLLTGASAIDGPSRGALAAVALETDSNLLKSKSTAANIITDKQLARQLNYELRKVLKDKIKGKVVDEDHVKLEKKVQSFNTIPNAVKLESAFENLGITLDEQDEFCISSRNSFLHGGLPKNQKLSFLTEHELVFWVSQRLIMLTGMQLLKKAGYSGLVNDWGLYGSSETACHQSGKDVEACRECT